MKEIKDNLTNKKDVFVIGYGASGAGKTSTLIYDKTAIKKGNKDKADGAIVFTLNQLAENNDPFKHLTLTITELFMDDPIGGDEKITPKAFDKIKDVQFDYDNVKDIFAFRANFNYSTYIRPLGDIESKGKLLLDEKNFDGGGDTTFTLSEILQLLIDKKRKVSATTNNPQSSRSHVLVTIKFTIEGQNVFLYIGDFAGVENKFDYTFKYSTEPFKDLINQIFSNMEDLRTRYPKKVQLINEILAADYPKQVKLLTNTRIINSLLEILFKKGLISDTIWNFSDLQHAQEKWVEEYTRVYGTDVEEELSSEQKKQFKDDGHNYFYQTAKPIADDFKHDGEYKKMIEEMEKMIKFLVSPTGYNDKKIYHEKHVRKLKQGDNPFKPEGSETQEMRNLKQKIEVLTQQKQGIQGQIKQIELAGGLGDYINAFDEEKPTDLAGEIRRDFLKIERIAGGDFKLKFPFVKGRIEWNLGKGYNGIDKTEVLTSLMREYFDGLYIQGQTGLELPIKANVTDRFALSILKDIELYIKFDGTLGKRRLEFVFDKVNCARTSRFYTTYLHRGGSGGGTFEQVNPGQDSVLTTIYNIGNGTAVDEDFFKKELVPKFFNGMSQDVNSFISSQKGKKEEVRYRFVSQIYDYIQSRPIEAFIKQRANRIITSEDSRQLNDEYIDLNHTRAQKSKGIEQQTGPLKQQQGRIDDELNTINTVDIPKEAENSKKNTIIAEALVKRTIEVHYEVIRRTYEGLFINESLAEMRNTMTNVLQQGSDTAIVPNFYSKCTNYYTNPLLEPLFKAETSSGNTGKDSFNIIHQILVKNKTGIHETPSRDKIIKKLQKQIVYCVCLLINNTYTDTNDTFNQNPPKIPYIDLTEGFTELTRFKKRNSKIIDRGEIHDVKNLVFKRYTHEKAERRSNNDNELIDEKLQTIIQSITGYSYDDFTFGDLHFSIFENIHNYLLYCYRMSCYAKEGEDDETSGETKTYYGNGNKSIAQSKIKEINDKFKLFEDKNRRSQGRNKTQVNLKSLIELAEEYLKSIDVMNATSIIGTIDFADEISKYNLKYNKCSVSQFNFDYKLDSYEEKRFLYSSEYDYLQNFRNYDRSASKFGVHLYIPTNHEFIINNLWPSYILPSILKLDENKDVYTSLLLNKMSGLTHENKMLGFINEFGVQIEPQNVKFFKKLNRQEIKFSKFEVTFNTEKTQIKIKFGYTNDSGVTAEETLQIDLTQSIQSQLTSISDAKMKLKKELKIEDEKILKQKLENLQSQRKQISDEIISKKEDFEDFQRRLSEAKARSPRVVEPKTVQAKPSSSPPPSPLPTPSPPAAAEAIPLSSPQPPKVPLPTSSSPRPANVPELELSSIPQPQLQYQPPQVQQQSEEDPRFRPLEQIRQELGTGSGALQDLRSLSRLPRQTAAPSRESFRQPPPPSLQQVPPVTELRSSIVGVKPLPSGRSARGPLTNRASGSSWPSTTAMGPTLVAGKPFDHTGAFNSLQKLYPNGNWKTSKQLETLKANRYNVEEVLNSNGTGMILRLIHPRKGGSKTIKNLKLKLMPAKKIERKYKQSFKNKVKLNHSQVNRSKLLNENANNKTKKQVRLNLKEKKKNVRKYKQSFKNKK